MTVLLLEAIVALFELLLVMKGGDFDSSTEESEEVGDSINLLSLEEEEDVEQQEEAEEWR